MANSLAQMRLLAIDDLKTLAARKSHGEVDSAEFEDSDNLRAYVEELLGVRHTLSDVGGLLNILVAIDNYARDTASSTDVPDSQSKPKTTSAGIVQAVGVLIRIRDSYPDLVGERRRQAAKDLGYQSEKLWSSGPGRQYERYLKRYLTYIASKLADDVACDRIIESARSLAGRGIKPDSKPLHHIGRPTVGTQFSLPRWAEISGVRSMDRPPIFEREAEFARVRDWISGQGAILLLAGDSGNGKSTIASETLLASEVSDRVYYLDAANAFSLASTINRYLDGEPVVNETAALERFASVVGNHRGDIPAPIVFIDNLDDFARIAIIAHWAPRILITAEERIVPGNIDHAVVDIEPLAPATAASLVKWFRPNEAEDDITRFVELVSSKPRIIIDCLGMYEADEMTLAEMSDLIEEERVRLIQRSGTSERAVDRLYRGYFDRLEITDVVASLLLACIAHLSDESVPAAVCGRTMEEFCRVNPEYGQLGSRSTSVYAKPLIRRYLIRRESSMIRSHGVTTLLFRDVTDKIRVDVIKAFVGAYFKLRSKLMTESVGHIHPELILWAPTICTVIKSTKPEILASIDAEQLNLLVADVRVGMVYLGRFEDYLDLIQTKNGVSLGYIEYRQMLDACYLYGRLRRDAYVAMIEEFHRNNRVVGDVDVAMKFNKAMAQYQMREFATSPQSHIDTSQFERGDAEVDVSRVNALRMICIMAESLGFGVLAKDTIASLDRERLGSRPVVAFNAARSAIRFLRRYHDVCALADWCEFLKRIGSARELDGSPMFEAAELESQAWLARALISDRETAITASNSFVAAALRKVAIGDRRRAAELYTEAVIIEGVFDTSPESTVERASLQHLVEYLDEPHLECRRAIAAEYIRWRESVYTLNLVELRNLTALSVQEYQDFPGYSLGLGAQVMLLSGRSSRKGELRNAFNELSKVIATRFAFSTEGGASDWVTSRVADKTLLVRI